jgi:hypothetical protein
VTAASITNTMLATPPLTKAAVTSNWLRSYDATTGLFTASQPAFTDISSSVAAGQMPALTGAVTTSAGAVATSPGKIDVLNSSAFCQAAGASTTTYTCNLSPAITAYVTGTHYRFKADVANTAASTINFNAQGAKTIKKATGGITTDIAANDMQAGQWVDIVYDGTNMQMQSLLGNAGVASVSGTANQIASTGGTTPVLSITNPFIFPGKATFAAATTSNTSFNIPSGTAPTTPNAGDVWLDTNEEKHFVQSSTAGGIKLYDSGGTNNVLIQPGGTVTSYTFSPPLAKPTNNNSAWLVSNATPGVGSFSKMQQVAFLTSNYTNATTTFSSLTGMSFAVEASTNYKVECDLDYQTSATTADVKIQWTGPASPTFLVYDMVTEVTASTLSSGVNPATATTTGAFSTAVTEAGTPTITTNFPMKLTMTLINGANSGTIQLQAAATGVGTITILPGACTMQ